MLERKLYIGIPKGNLNSREQNRGYTQLLLRNAGWELSGYDPGKEENYPKILSGDKEVQFVCMRPRSLPIYEKEGMIDIIICGEDIIREYSARMLFNDFKKHSSDIEKSILGEKYPKLAEGYQLVRDIYQPAIEIYKKLIEERVCRSKFPYKKQKDGFEIKALKNKFRKICDLGYGKVNLHFGVSNKISKFLSSLEGLNKFGKVYTEYPYLAYWNLCNFFHPNDITFDGGLNRRCGGMDIIALNGTEIFISNPSREIIFDCVSSGKHLKDNNIVTFGEPVLTSTVGLYYNNLSAWAKVPAHIDRHCNSLKYQYLDPSKSKYFKISGPIWAKDNKTSPFLKLIGKYRREGAKNYEWIEEKIKEVAKKLHKAAVKYGEFGEKGEGRKDSIYHKS